MERKWIIMILFLLLVLVEIVEGKDGISYHNLDVPCYEDVRVRLKTPIQLNAYCQENFIYENDQDQFGKVERWQSPEEMVYNERGDCEDHAIFQHDVLRFHGIPAELWIVFGEYDGHAIVVFPYEKKWTYMDCQKGGKRDSIQHPLFDTKEEAIRNTYGERTQDEIEITPEDLRHIITASLRINDPILFFARNSERCHRILPEAHLTEETKGMKGVHVLHKMEAGYLHRRRKNF